MPSRNCEYVISLSLGLLAAAGWAVDQGARHRNLWQTWEMDEAMAESVRAYVRESAPRGKSGLPKRLHLDGLAILIVDMNTKDCEMVSANYVEKAAVIRLRGTTAAAEGVEKMAEFWEAAAAMLEAAEVTTLGELLEDDEG